MALLGLAGLLSACGGSRDSSSSLSDRPTTEGAAAVSAEFLSGTNQKILKFGHEADVVEREAVSAVLEENLKARAAGDWAGQCASLAAPPIKSLLQATASLNAGKGCAQRLKAAAGVAEARAGKAQSKAAAEAEGRKGKGPPSIRTDTLQGPIDAFRVGGSLGYALYHGVAGLDYAMKMKKEDGEWKVDSLVTTEP